MYLFFSCITVLSTTDHKSRILQGFNHNHPKQEVQWFGESVNLCILLTLGIHVFICIYQIVTPFWMSCSVYVMSFHTSVKFTVILVRNHRDGAGKVLRMSSGASPFPDHEHTPEGYPSFKVPTDEDCTPFLGNLIQYLTCTPSFSQDIPQTSPATMGHSISVSIAADHALLCSGGTWWTHSPVSLVSHFHSWKPSICFPQTSINGWCFLSISYL